jgi:ketosteroid isomerase-like protein
MTTPADVVRSYLASFATGDPETVAAHVTDGFVNDHTAALGTGFVGREEYLRRLPGFLAMLEGLRYDDIEVIAEGERVAATYRLRATSDGHDVDIRGAMVFDVADGLIARRTDFWDSLVYLRQVGQA